MDDRELLELAAKAAGMNGEYVEHFGEVGIARNRTGIWNPLEDDGDALRLAVKLNLHVQIDFDDRDCECVFVYGNYYADHPVEEFGNDPYAATRRAIVRAAAEIGKEI